MSEQKSLLVELGTEELPVKALPGLAQAFFDGVITALEKRGIGFERAGIAVEVLVRAELRRVHEHARDDPVGALARRVEQRMVAVVEVPHGRHEADAQAVAAPAGDAGAQLGDGVGAQHQYDCSAVGYSRARTASP